MKHVLLLLSFASVAVFGTEAPVTFYQNAGYGSGGGYGVTLAPGHSYTLSALTSYGIKGNDISSVKVPAGIKVVLFSGDNYTGSSLALTENCSDLSWKNFNDKTNSLQIIYNPAQNHFIIGSLVGPAMMVNADANNVSKLSTFRKAGFNLLGTYSGMTTSGNIEWNPPFEGNRYLLQKITDLNASNKEQEGLQALILDTRWFKDSTGNFNAIADACAADYKINLASNLRDALYGYLLGDEPIPLAQILKPHPNPYDINRARTWNLAFNARDPSKVAYEDLCGWWKDLTLQEYQTYIATYYQDKSTMTGSFDYYPFFQLGYKWAWDDNSTTIKYFKNLDMFRQNCYLNQKIFWGVPYVGQETTVNANTATRENVRFSYFAPITYGAKGIMDYYYWPIPILNSSAFQPGLMNISQNTDLGTPRPVFNWVSSLNKYLHNMGPILMSSGYFETFHGRDSDPSSMEPVTPFTAPQTLSPTILNISSYWVAVGKGVSTYTPLNPSYPNKFMVVFNKRRNEWNDANHKMQRVTVTLSGHVYLQLFNKQKMKWLKIAAVYNSATNSTDVTLALLPGDAELLSVGENSGTLMVDDINGDGATDKVIMYPSSNVVDIELGQQNGDMLGIKGFSPLSGYTFAGPQEFLVGDVNGDKCSDLIHFTANAVKYWPGYGNGKFKTPVTVSQTVDTKTPFNAKDFIVGDFDGDGCADFIHIVPGNSTYYVWYGNKSGTFTVKTFLPWAGYGITTPDYYLVGDFDGDGKSDVLNLIPSSSGDDYINCWYGTTQATPFTCTSYKPWAGYKVGKNTDYMVEDFSDDPDGKEDIVQLPLNDNSTVYRFLSTGRSFTAENMLTH